MLACHFSRPASRNSLNENLVTSGISSKNYTELQNKAATSEELHLGQMVQGLSSVQSFSSALHSPSIRSRTLDHHLVGKSASPGLPNVVSRVRLGDGIIVSGSNSLNGFSSGVNSIADIVAFLAGLNMSKDQFHNRDNFLDSQLQMGISDAHPQNMQLQFLNKSRAENMAIVTNYPLLVRENGFAPSDLNNSSLGLNGQLNFPRRSYSLASLHSQVNDPGFTSPSSGASIKGQSLRRNVGQAGSNHPTIPMDARHVQHFHESYNHKMNAGVLPGNPTQIRNFIRTSHGRGDFRASELMYLETLLAEQKQQYQSPMYGSSGLQRQYHENPALDLCMPYQGNQMAKSVFPTVGSRTAMCQNE